MYKVLIVEDDPMVTMINEQYVSKNPQFEVVTSCRNGKEVFEYLKNNKVEVLTVPNLKNTLQSYSNQDSVVMA